MIAGIVRRFAAGLRFPTLFALVGAMFVLDVLLPDLIPFMDEIMLALGTVLLASLRKRSEPPLEPGGETGVGPPGRAGPTVDGAGGGQP